MSGKKGMRRKEKKDIRIRLREWMDQNGRKQVELREALHVDGARMCRFLRGEASLGTVDHYRAIEEWTDGAIKADELAAEAPPTGTKKTLERARREEAEPVGATIGALLFDPALPGELAEAAGCPKLAPLFDAELRLAFGARTEGARQRAIADLMNRVNGLPTQKVVDLTPRPPAEASDLIALFDTILRPKTLEPVPDAPAPEEAADLAKPCA